MEQLVAAREERKRARAEDPSNANDSSVEAAFQQIAKVFADAKKDRVVVDVINPNVHLLRSLESEQRQQVFQLIANTPGYRVGVRFSEDTHIIVPGHVFDWVDLWHTTYDHFENVIISLE